MEDSSGSLPTPALPPIFRNSYWILRHGRSIPNERGLIVSSLVRILPILHAVVLQFPEPKKNHESNPRIQLMPPFSVHASCSVRRMARSRSSG